MEKLIYFGVILWLIGCCYEVIRDKNSDNFLKLLGIIFIVMFGLIAFGIIGE